MQEEGWTSFRNEMLLSRAQHSFDVLLTADRRLQFQQKLSRFEIGVVVTVTHNLRLRTILVALDQIREGLATVKSGEVVTVHVP